MQAEPPSASVMAVIVSPARMCGSATDMRAGWMWSCRRGMKKALMVAFLMMFLPRMMHDEDWCVATGINRQAIGVRRVTSRGIAIGGAVIGAKASLQPAQ